MGEVGWVRGTEMEVGVDDGVFDEANPARSVALGLLGDEAVAL
jgi:hypothetical protein